MKLRSLLVIPICAQMGWSAATLTLKDPKDQPIAGVTCIQEKNIQVTGADGSVTFQTVGVLPQIQGPKNSPLFYLPISAGERASVAVFDSRGHRVAFRDIGLGDRIDLATTTPGIYYIRVQGRDIAVNQSVVVMGQSLTFNGVAKGTTIGSGASLRKVAAAAEVVCSKDGYATKTYQINNNETKTIGFGMKIGRKFDPNAYTKYQGFNLEVVEDFNTADWPNGLTWDANHVSNDTVWEPSDAGFESNQTRFDPSQVKFKDNAMVMVMEKRTMPGGYTHSESDNCAEEVNNRVCRPSTSGKRTNAPDRSLASGEVRTKENAFRYGRYEITIDPPDAAKADGFIAAMFTWYTPRDRYWREIDVEILANKESSYLTNLFHTNSTGGWQSHFATPRDSTKPKGTFNPRASNTYAFVWLPGVVKWYVNDELVRTVPSEGDPLLGRNLDPPNGPGGYSNNKLEVSRLSSKVVMNFWLLNKDVGGEGKGNQYPLEAKFDNFKYYRWDEDGDKTKYPETP